MTEYLYGETLRWSFGFESPNKAAAIFACLLPLCWWAWAASWGIRRAGLRISALVVTAGAFLAAGTCLVMTFSRGGLVAGLAALGYVWALAIWRGRRRGENGGNSAKISGVSDVGRPSRLPVCGGNSRRDARSTSLNFAPFGTGGASGAVAEAGADGAVPSRQGGAKSWLSAALVVALVCLAVWSGLAGRSAESLGDASVTHRIDLWKAGLQMACENPAGFGSGQSGREFMQWYQATDRTEGYRTMVNSYLTFLVEQGRGMFALAVFGFLVFWFSMASPPGSPKSTGKESHMEAPRREAVDAKEGLIHLPHKNTCPAEPELPSAAAEAAVPSHLQISGIRTAFRGSILAFLVAGIFSTTMEDWGLWIIPACCIIVLVATRCLRPRALTLRPLVRGLCGTCAMVFGLWLAGFSQSRSDLLARTFAPSREGRSVVAIAPKGGKKTIWFVPDAAVLGPMYGKLLRSLALETKSEILLGGNEGALADLVVLAGDAVNGHRPDDGVPLLLLAPAKMEEAQARAILGRKGRVLLLFPEIDEDGRSSFWRNLAGQNPRDGLVCRELGGVGTQVDWAWDQVMDCIRE
ncbi:MAG: O-antigen ligase family protein [Terrimicrobiaceae bacterium]|nr:O-antigen ligase family protein [Terrimicrobiaceae bacterium]